MPRLLVDPLNLNYVLIGIAALTSAGYFIRVRDKSAATWYMLAFLTFWAFYNLVLAFAAFMYSSITVDALFYSSPLGTSTLIIGALAGPMLAQAAYRFRNNRFPREANLVLPLSAATVVAVISYLIGTPTYAVGWGRWLVALWSIWGVVVLLRKRRSPEGTDWTIRDKNGMLAFALFLLVVAVSETVDGWNLIVGSPRSIGQYGLGQILQFTVVLAFPVVYVQYAPEPTTFQVKLVGFVLLIVLAVFGVLNSFQSALDGQRQAFDPAPPPHSLVFRPVESGFEITKTDLSFVTELGEDLRLVDDSKAIVPLPFGFPFDGDTIRTVVVDANGAIEPASEPSPFVNFSTAYPTVTERPLIAAWYTDLNPGAGGSVYARVKPDRLIVTWKDVPEWNYFLPHTIQAVLYETGQIDFNYLELPFDTYVGASGVLTKRTSAASGIGRVTSNFDPFIGTGAVAVPFAVYDRRREFKEYLHRQTMPFVWVVLGTIALVLIVAPVFFRLSLIRPLDLLLKGMRKVNDGDLEAELPLGVKDEFGYLAQNFNRMTKSLRTYSGEMELLVEERTRELNQSLESLKATQEQLVQQEKMASLGHLTAGIAHEIKNPLNFINNFSELNAELADELLEAIGKGEDATEIILSLKQNAQVIAEHGHRADSIVRSMMEHARHGASPMEPVDVNAFVEEYLNLAFHGHRAAKPDFHVTLERSYAPDAGFAPMLRQDMSRVLINLLGNAFDAVSAFARTSKPDQSTDAAGHEYEPTVRIATRRERAANGTSDHVVIEVQDNGPGVPLELKQRIFEPFFTTKPTGQGTGLGLSLSYDIVTGGHGGTLTLTDAEGGGAQFILTLPT